MANPSTDKLVQFSQIADSVIVLKDGSLRSIVEITAINFELRSSDEQSAILQQFEAFLNAIDFPFQIVVQSRRFDISAYVAGIEQASTTITSDLLKVQAQEYARFVRELSGLANIMSKRFYVVIPFHAAPSETGKKGGFLSGLFGKKPAALPTAGMTPEQLANWQAQLTQRAELVLGGLSGMGLKGHILRQDELVRLFTDLYNPTVPETTQHTA